MWKSFNIAVGRVIWLASILVGVEPVLGEVRVPFSIVINLNMAMRVFWRTFHNHDVSILVLAWIFDFFVSSAGKERS